MLLWKLGIRNSFRNKRRTFISMLVIAMGFSSMVLLDAYILGVTEYMLNDATSTFIGDAQVHNKSFKLYNESKYTIDDEINVIQNLQQDVRVKKITKRVTNFAMVSSAQDMKNVSLYGVDLESEKGISKINEAIVKGRTFSKENEILMGEALVEYLDLRLNEKVVLTTANAYNSEIKQELFRLAGIFRFGTTMDKSIVFIPIEKAQKLVGISNQSHEIIVKFDSYRTVEHMKESAWQIVGPNNIYESWKKVVPDIGSMQEMTSVSRLIMAILLMIIVVVAIINSLFMSLYERLFEFAVFRAVGTKVGQIRKMIVIESAILAILGITLGIIITLPFAYFLLNVGIDFTGLEYGSVTFKEPIYGIFKWNYILESFLLVFSITVLSSIYPAWYAGNISLAEAMKKSL